MEKIPFPDLDCILLAFVVGKKIHRDDNEVGNRHVSMMLQADDSLQTVGKQPPSRFFSPRTETHLTEQNPRRTWSRKEGRSEDEARRQHPSRAGAQSRATAQSYSSAPTGRR